MFPKKLKKVLEEKGIEVNEKSRYATSADCLKHTSNYIYSQVQKWKQVQCPFLSHLNLPENVHYVTRKPDEESYQKKRELTPLLYSVF